MNTAMASYQFCAGRWVADERFVGRRALLEDAQRALLAGGPTGRRYVGRRRQGKTSLLHAIGALLRAHNQPDRVATAPEGLAGFIAQSVRAARLPAGVLRVPAYVDLAIQQGIHEVAARIALGAERPLNMPFFSGEVRSSDRPVDILLEALDAAMDLRPFQLVVLADEGHALLKDEGGARVLLQLLNQSEVPVRVFLTSTRGLDLRARGATRALVEALPTLTLGNLQPAAVDAMLADAGLDPGQQRGLKAVCGGNPFFLHVLGFALQNPVARPESQIVAGVENDLSHLLKEEVDWLRALARGKAAPAPASRWLLEQLSYVTVREPPALVEPLLAAQLAGRPLQPLIDATRLGVTAPADTGPALRLRLGPKPTRQYFGDALVRRAACRLGAQGYLLVWMLAEAARREGVAGLSQDDLTYGLGLGLSFLGIKHRTPRPRALVNDVRKLLPEPELLPSGRGGYRLVEGTVLEDCEEPFGHLAFTPPDLLELVLRWRDEREALLSFLRASVVSPARGVRLELRLRALAMDLFPHHAFALGVAVRELDSGHDLVSLGPIPLTEREGEAFLLWQEAHLDAGRVKARSADASAVHPVELVRPLDTLGLGGERFKHQGRRWSSRWLPAADTVDGFVTAPRWLDVGFVDRRGDGVLTVEEVGRWR
ncbi:MAG: hypothetical protein H6739_34480 [Alphaproteobacteria bacterium]|nr:hypothetical protein [Alphaproteobacteria bacterium]